ncbi:hypothetical protein DOY81_007360 [Sarcophaga bullata]|nr:hypothetical protein DOY81_007360 [Sarcophaga bullata]
MNLNNFLKICVLTLFAAIFYQNTNITAIPIQCGREANCTVTPDSEVCILDDTNGPCIRKYASKCHLDIAACKQGKNLTDYSPLYCAMDAYLCEEGYEHWTIFFGHEKD